MNIEQITTPPAEASPEARYASLHRTVEAGIVGDSTWSELSYVCAELGKKEEAEAAYGRIKGSSARIRAQSYLISKGILGRPAKKVERRVTDADLTHSFGEEVADSFRFLFYEHMPLTVLVATMAFPLVVGIGGILTAGTSSLVLAAIAVVPALSVLGLVGALSRRILIEASNGIDDPPRLPGVASLIKESSRFLFDGVLLATVLLGPAVVALLLGASLWATIPTAILGAALLPMAMAIRQLTDNWTVFSPNVLFTAVVRGGARYLGTAAVAIGLFLPAAFACYMTLGSAMFMMVSVIGPVAVAPMFVVSRLMGCLLDNKRAAIGSLVGMPRQKKTARLANSVAHVADRLSPVKKKSRPARQVAEGHRPTTQPDRSKRSRTPLGAATHPESRRQRPSSKPKQASSKVRTPGTTKRAQTKRAPMGPSIIGEAAPDLTQMPGFNVVSGNARVLAGASSNTSPKD